MEMWDLMVETVRIGGEAYRRLVEERPFGLDMVTGPAESEAIKASALLCGAKVVVDEGLPEWHAVLSPFPTAEAERHFEPVCLSSDCEEGACVVAGVLES